MLLETLEVWFCHQTGEHFATQSDHQAGHLVRRVFPDPSVPSCGRDDGAGDAWLASKQEFGDRSQQVAATALCGGANDMCV